VAVAATPGFRFDDPIQIEEFSSGKDYYVFRLSTATSLDHWNLLRNNQVSRNYPE
jgi:hypothetical protein